MTRQEQDLDRFDRVREAEGAVHKERAAEIEAAAESLLAVACYVDNGYCSICYGYWPNDHREHCQGARLKAAFARAKEQSR